MLYSPRITRMMAGTFTITTILALAGCGGSSSSTPTTPQGTKSTTSTLSAADKILQAAGVPQSAWKQLEMVHADYAFKNGDFGAGIPMVFAHRASTSTTTHKDILDQPNGPNREAYSLNSPLVLNSPYTASQIKQYQWHAVATSAAGAGEYIGIARQAPFYDGYENLTQAPSTGMSDLQVAKNGILSRSIFPVGVSPSDMINQINSYNAVWINGAGDTGKALCGTAAESPTYLIGPVKADGSQGESCTDLTSDQTIGVTPALLDPNTKNNYIVVGEVDVNTPGTPTTQGTFAGSDPNVEATFISAPGYGVVTADNNTGGYNTGNGSSFAAPMVAGAIADVRAAYPSLTAQQVRKVILESANTGFSTEYQKNTCGTNGTTNCGKYYFGVGMLDIEAALKLAASVVQGTATL